MSKQNLKYSLILMVVGILFYRFTAQPQIFYRFFAFLAQLLQPFFIAILVAVLADSMVKSLERRFKFPRFLSVLITYLTGVAFISICCVVVIPSCVVGFSNLFDRTTTFLNSIEEDHWMYQFINNNPYIEQLLIYVQQNSHNIAKNLLLLLNGVSSSLYSSFLGVATQVMNWFLGITISIYLVIDQKKILKEINRFLKAFFPKKQKRIIYLARFSYQSFQYYMIGRLVDSLIVGFLALIGFYFLKTPFITLFAFIIFITNIIPYFGPIIGAFFPILMTAIMEPSQTLWVAGYILILQQIDANIIGPKIMGDYVGLSPLWIISVILVGGSLFGFVGLFLAVPTSAVMKEIYDLIVKGKLNSHGEFSIINE